MKKLLCLLCAVMLIVPSLSVCEQEDMRTFTDSLGREVQVPEKIERIAVTGSIGKITVFAIGHDLLVGIPEPWDEIEKQYIAPECHDMAVLGQVYGGKGQLNLEELLLAAPQVVIDIGEPKAGVAEDMDNLQAQTGIPWVHISAYLESMDHTYEKLGELLGRKEQGNALAAYCRKTYDDLAALAEKADKVNMLYVLGEKGLNVLAKGSFHGVVIDLMANNLAVVDNPLSKGTGNEVDMEQILNWNPDIVVFAADSIYETVDDDPLWQGVTAIANGTYYEVPMGPFNWMGMPPAAQRLLGLMWMGKVFYPELATYDMYEKLAEYYELFYHHELTQEQYAALMKNSLAK